MTTPKFQTGDRVETTGNPGLSTPIIRTRQTQHGWEYLIGRPTPDVVGFRPDGTPIESYGYPHWTQEHHLTRATS